MSRDVMPIYLVKRNDLVFTRDPETGKDAWERVASVHHEPGHPVVLLFVGGDKVVQDAGYMVEVRKLRLVSR